MPIRQNWGIRVAVTTDPIDDFKEGPPWHVLRLWLGCRWPGWVDALADLVAGLAVGLLLVGLVVTENYSGAVALAVGFLLGAKWRLMQ